MSAVTGETGWTGREGMDGLPSPLTLRGGRVPTNGTVATESRSCDSRGPGEPGQGHGITM